jgi:molybdopterin adenylyltransferase
MVLEARRLVDETTTDAAQSGNSDDSIHAAGHLYADQLNQFGYDQAAQLVYGMHYGDWKNRFQQKASDEQLQRYQTSQPLWAKHDEDLLQTRENATDPLSSTTAAVTQSDAALTKHDIGATSKIKPLLASNVCCETVPEPAQVQQQQQQPSATTSNNTTTSRLVPPYTPPSFANFLWKNDHVRVHILTVSDRAYQNQYPSGDLSGPAVEQAVQDILGDGVRVSTRIVIVPDEVEAIQSQLIAWCDDEDTTDSNPQLILTTGGTGMSARDVTPEATRAILHQEASGLMGFVSIECSRKQPLASLSRGTAGLRHETFIANLPGNPMAAQEVLSILLPLLVHGLEL